MKLVVGLGNPGKEYADTRHNAGATFAQRITREYGTRSKKHNGVAAIANVSIDDEKIIIAIPLSYMNESGPAVAALAKYYHIPVSSVIVAYDDLDLPFGTLRISTNTTSGGHNGVRSVIDALGSSSFSRIRIGIGPQTEVAEDFVLKRWTASQKKELPKILTKAQSALETLVQKGLTAAANLYN